VEHVFLSSAAHARGVGPSGLPGCPLASWPPPSPKVLFLHCAVTVVCALYIYTSVLLHCSLVYHRDKVTQAALFIAVLHCTVYEAVAQKLYSTVLY